MAMNKITNRNFIEDYLLRRMVGPGYTEELYEWIPNPDRDHEVIDQPVAALYSSGILKAVPPAGDSEQSEDLEVVDEEEALGAGEAPEESEELEGFEPLGASEDSDEGDTDRGYGDDRDSSELESESKQENKPEGYQHHCGLLVCLDETETELKIELSYARYQTVKGRELAQVRLKVGYLYEPVCKLLAHYDERVDMPERFLAEGRAFSSYFELDEERRSISFSAREGEALLPELMSVRELPRITPDQMAAIAEGATEDYYAASALLRKLVRAVFSRRKSYERCETWQIADILGQEQPLEYSSTQDDLGEVWLYVQEVAATSDGRRYIKVLLHNKDKAGKTGSEKHLCQVKLKLTPKNNLLSYRDLLADADDPEQAQIEYLYRDVREYGKGIGCATRWEDKGKWIETDFAPQVDIKRSANSLDKTYCADLTKELEKHGLSAEGGFDHKQLESYCHLHTLSHWSELDDETYIERLRHFAEAYKLWHRLQRAETAEDAEDERRGAIVRDLLDKQEALATRLTENVDYLEENPEALKYFRYANTAMLIQMVIARDAKFAKQRDRSEVQEGAEVFASLGYFESCDEARKAAYRPFQLAFLLMNVRSTMEQDDPYRTDGVDLIWFPTGGGKTEAYLALTALTIIYRRHYEEQKLAGGMKPGGVAVIMRYTLRLLTSQQFERASYLICALEFMRTSKELQKTLPLGDKPISIGMWVGSSVTPNESDKYKKALSKFNENRKTHKAPSPVTYCPWCGANLHSEDESGGLGYLDKGKLQCINEDCHFSIDRLGNKLPILFVDEEIYKAPPTLLFATVDKFAQLPRKKSHELLGLGDEGKACYLSPNLIIQDELHLISGPLGSMVGLFETVVQYLATAQAGRCPKIVASTATTRNTNQLVTRLYNREVHTFPASGTSHDDNFFSHIEKVALRRHLGFSSHHSLVKAELRLLAHLFLARFALLKKVLEEQGVDLNDDEAVIQALLTNDGILKDGLDNYWALVGYYTSLKEVGRIRSRVAQELKVVLGSGKRYLGLPRSFRQLVDLVGNGRVEEFTGRIESARVKTMLTNAEAKATFEAKDGRLHIKRGKDIVLATNMISVGIDIPRWNLMLMSRLPASTAEYIQATSRVARREEGLVVNLFSRNVRRGLSVYENYTAFHSSYYRHVEPLSITPATRAIFSEKILTNMLDCVEKKMYSADKEDCRKELIRILTERFELDEKMQEYLEQELNREGRGRASSLRDIEANLVIKISSK